jgi:hypothetical protein
MCISYFSYRTASGMRHVQNEVSPSEAVQAMQAEVEVSIIYLIACSVLWVISTLCMTSISLMNVRI